MQDIITDRVVERFWAKVNKKGPLPHKRAIKVHPEISGTRCWEWLGHCRTQMGHGGFPINGVVYLAHRVAYAIINEGWPLFSKKNVLHKCDNPKCVRPLHLFLGSQLQNVLDMVIKRRHGTVTHPERVNRKIPVEHIPVLCRQYSDEGYSCSELGAMYGVTRNQIWHILKKNNVQMKRVRREL